MKTVFDTNSLRILIAIGLAKTNNSLRVIDFGGSGDYHQTIASKAFVDKDDLK